MAQATERQPKGLKNFELKVFEDHVPFACVHCMGESGTDSRASREKGRKKPFRYAAFRLFETKEGEKNNNTTSTSDFRGEREPLPGENTQQRATSVGIR